MRPTKSKELIAKTAKDLNLSEDLITDVINFYYDIVSKKIENLNSPTIFLHGLGTLRISRKKLKRDIDGLNKLLNSSDKEDFKKVIKFNLSKTLLELKENSLELCNQYYKSMYEKRYKNLEK